MMHPTAATRYLHMQIPVVNDFVSYLEKKRNSDGLVEDLYEDLFKYTMEGMTCSDCCYKCEHKSAAYSCWPQPTMHAKGDVTTLYKCVLCL